MFLTSSSSFVKIRSNVDDSAFLYLVCSLTCWCRKQSVTTSNVRTSILLAPCVRLLLAQSFFGTLKSPSMSNRLSPAISFAFEIFSNSNLSFSSVFVGLLYTLPTKVFLPPFSIIQHHTLLPKSFVLRGRQTL
ncbi:unnamed protein product [Meganyctiphanes norvegica]|uniref:Uncharacterized protein n=1 Tax=Meganyctiphanes norvegica TaxID=48144 RepID=A0AAV2PXC5_MEGNR